MKYRIIKFGNYYQVFVGDEENPSHITDTQRAAEKLVKKLKKEGKRYGSFI